MIFKSIYYLIKTLGLVLLVTINTAYAYDLAVGLGNFSEHIGVAQTDDQGNKAWLTFNPYLQIKTNFQFDILPKTDFIETNIGITLPKSDRDPNTSRLKYFINANYKHHFESVYLSLGTGLFFTRVWANGGEEELDNGAGTTSFPLPDRASVARNMIVNLALGKRIDQELNIELHTFIFNIESTDNRSFTAGINLSYFFGEIK